MKDAHLHFRDGNVIKAPGGDLWIVIDVNDDVISAVSFDCENCSATQKLDDHERNETCHCGDCPEYQGEPQEDCEDCHGTGRYTKKIKGWRHSKIVASTVKEFIMKGVKRQFGI
jgi:hypothetical protein